MKNKVFFLIFPGLIYSEIVLSNNFPIEFTDFFEERIERIEVMIAGETRSQFIDGLVTYDIFRLSNNEQNITTFTEYLKRHRLTEVAAKNIVTQLISGVVANPGCEGVLSTCIPQDKPDAAEFVFDFDAQQLKVFVGGDMLDRQTENAEYYSSTRFSNALINWSDLYFYVDGEGDNVNWSNNTTLGLPLGFLSLETQYQHSQRKLELYQALYDVEIGKNRGILGYQGRQAVTFNSTDFLNYGANYAGLELSVGSSQNLLKGKKLAQKRIYFFAPESSQLEVYQGERLLFSSVVPQGQQSIGYDQLPSGIYNLTLVLKQGEQEILREQRQVVNTAQFSLPVNTWDYRVGAGVLEDLTITKSPLAEPNPSGGQGYSRIAFAYRPSETWLLASGVSSNIDDTLLQTGGYWAYRESLEVQYNLGFFTSGYQSHFGQVIIGALSLSYRYVDTDNKASLLPYLLYGDSSFRDWSVGLSGKVLGGNGFVNYFNYQTKETQSNNVSFSFSRDVFGGRLSLNATYSIYGEKENSWNTTLAWSIKLGDNISARTGLQIDKYGLAYSQTSVTYQRNSDYGYMSSTVGDKKGKESNIEWSANLSGNRESVGYSAYTYLNTDRQRSFSGNLSGTQILSSQGRVMTHEKGRAFVSIEPKLMAPEIKPIDITYNILENGEYWYQDKASIDESTLIKLNTYTDVSFELDADTGNVDIEEGKYSAFVMPGYYHTLDSKLTPLMSQVFILNDIFGSPISSARCLGEGCKSVEVLSDDGVVRVNYKKNEPFKLISEKRLCVYNPELIGDAYIQAYCLSGLDDLNSDIVKVQTSDLIAGSGRKQDLLYIGKYESTVEVLHTLSTLQDVGLVPESIVIGNDTYVYVNYLMQYNTAQRDAINSININMLFSARGIK